MNARRSGRSRPTALDVDGHRLDGPPDLLYLRHLGGDIRPAERAPRRPPVPVAEEVERFEPDALLGGDPGEALGLGGELLRLGQLALDARVLLVQSVTIRPQLPGLVVRLLLLPGRGREADRTQGHDHRGGVRRQVARRVQPDALGLAEQSRRLRGHAPADGLGLGEPPLQLLVPALGLAEFLLRPQLILRHDAEKVRQSVPDSLGDPFITLSVEKLSRFDLVFELEAEELGVPQRGLQRRTGLIAWRIVEVRRDAHKPGQVLVQGIRVVVGNQRGDGWHLQCFANLVVDVEAGRPGRDRGGSRDEHLEAGELQE